MRRIMWLETMPPPPVAARLDGLDLLGSALAGVCPPANVLEQLLDRWERHT